MELINYQLTEIIELESRRIWMTDVYVCKFFNEFAKGQIKNGLMKRVIINGMSGSSWRFKRFEHITMIVTKTKKNLLFLKIAYLNFEAEAFNEEEELNFSDNENDDDRSFINHNEQEDQPASFYRFVNQTRDPAEAVNADDGSHLDTRDLQPEMFIIDIRDEVEFDEFKEVSKCSELSLKSLLSFDDYIKHSFFNSGLYGLLFKLTENNRVSKDDIESTLGKKVFDKLNESKELLQLDDSLEGFFKKCVLANGFLEKKKSIFTGL